MPYIETGFDDYLSHWWYRIVGTGLSDRGYLNQKDAYECAVHRYWDNRPAATVGEILRDLDPDLRRIEQ